MKKRENGRLQTHVLFFLIFSLENMKLLLKRNSPLLFQANQFPVTIEREDSHLKFSHNGLFFFYSPLYRFCSPCHLCEYFLNPGRVFASNENERSDSCHLIAFDQFR
jgi:hypothetical protein